MVLYLKSSSATVFDTVCFVPETIKDSVVPLVCQYCQTAVESKTHHLVTVAENFGEFCHNLSGTCSLGCKRYHTSLLQYGYSSG